MAQNPNEIVLDEERTKLMDAAGHMLVMGGPGSGKTTIALLKAGSFVRQGQIQSGQKVLFLSFARTTITRVEERAQQMLAPQVRAGIQIDTYHGFLWSLLRTHGYLLLDRAYPIQLLAPPEAAAALAGIEEEANRQAEKERLFFEEGFLHFDLFAPLAARLLRRSETIRKIFSDAYPILILDEFQDTNDAEWEVIQLLGERSTVLALADPEQRIYEFRGASADRQAHFQDLFNPSIFDFETQNNRSSGTDIVQFGNDLLRGANRGRHYADVSLHLYPFRRPTSGLLDVKLRLLQRMQDIRKAGIRDWSVAILVPSKLLMLAVSTYIGSEQTIGTRRFPGIEHHVALETAGPSLAASLIGILLEVASSPITDARARMIKAVIGHIKGNRGDKGPTQASAKVANFLEEHIENKRSARGANQKALLESVDRVLQECRAIQLTGDPAADWLAVRSLIEENKLGIREIGQIVEDAKYLRLMNRGTALSSRLGELWRGRGSYVGAEQAVREALVEEHFSMSKSEPRGVLVMTMHKSKAKQFTETIVFEGEFQGRYVRDPSDPHVVAQARYLLRVAVTRAERHSSVFTSERSRCVLL